MADRFAFFLGRLMMVVQALRQLADQIVTFQIAAPALGDSLDPILGTHDIAADGAARIAIAILVAGHENGVFQMARLEDAVYGQGQGFIGFLAQAQLLHGAHWIAVGDGFVDSPQDSLHERRPFRISLEDAQGPSQGSADILTSCQGGNHGTQRGRR